MTQLITLAEAASYLGISKATLRNWDKDGKLKAHRHPINHYRVYDLDELRNLKQQTALFPEAELPSTISESAKVSDLRSVKRIIGRLHGILRDTDGDSNIIQRFDELTKMLFLKLITERQENPIFDKKAQETDEEYVSRIRYIYNEQSKKYLNSTMNRFGELNCSNHTIRQCGSVLASISFESANFDIKGVTYEEVIRNTFDKSDNQQFFTPHQVVSFMVKMLQPFLKGLIADPACGTAGFLVEVKKSGVEFTKLFGIEIDERLAWVSGINLLLHSAEHFEIKCLGEGGTLGPLAKPYFGVVDAILTNPPFGSDFSEVKALQDLILGHGRTSRRRGILFIERCWSLLKEGGIVGIIIDEGVLNLSSSKDVRQFILDRFEILAIVSLPETAFMPYANVNASILFLKKTAKSVRSTKVFFAKADNIGRKSNGDDDIIYEESGKERPNSDFPQILKQWHKKLAGNNVITTDKVFVTNVTKNLKNDNSLRFDFRYHHPSRNKSKDLLSRTKYPLYALVDLCEERNEIIVPSSEMPEQAILYTGLAHIESNNGVAHQVITPAASLKSAVKRYEPNDIVFARMRPNLRKIAIMTFAEGGYVSPECVVLTVRKTDSGAPLIKPEMLAVMLRSDLVFGQIMHLIAGIGRPRLNISDLRKVLIPIPPPNVQLEIKRDYEKRIYLVHDLRKKATSLLKEADSLEIAAVEELAKKISQG